MVAAFDCEISSDELETFFFQPSGFSVRTTVSYGGGTTSQGETRNGLFVANDPINLTDPLGLTWETNVKFLAQWLTGTSPNHINYAPDSVETHEIQNSLAAQRVRDAFAQSGNTGAAGVSYGTGEAAWDTLFNPKSADWSSTAAQIGGYAGATAVNNGDGTVTYTIPNTAGTHSFFYHLVPDRDSPDGPMSNVDQVFTWTEKIPEKKPCH